MTLATTYERSQRPRAIYESGRTPRRSGFVTQAMINQHGSFRAALAVLNGENGGHQHG